MIFTLEENVYLNETLRMYIHITYESDANVEDAHHIKSYCLIECVCHGEWKLLATNAKMLFECNFIIQMEVLHSIAGITKIFTKCFK